MSCARSLRLRAVNLRRVKRLSKSVVGIFAVPAGAVAWIDLGPQEGEVEVPLTGAPSGAAHPSDSCVMVFIEIAADVESQSEIVSEVPAGAAWFSPEGGLPHIPSLVRAAAWDERCVGVSTLGSADEGQARLSFLVAKARCQKNGEALDSRRGLDASSEAPASGRFSGHHARPHGRICWQAGRPRSQWGCAHASTVQFRSCDVGDARCPMKAGELALHEARTLLGAMPAPVAFVSPSSQFALSHQKATRLLVNPSVSPRYLQSWLQFWTNPQAHARWRKRSEWCGSGHNRCEIFRGSQWQRIRRRRAPAAGRPFPDAAHSAHPSQVPWSHHCDAREESSRG